ncbi:MAG: prolyl-tRNA synthetase associated domain-containing protein, partial [Proteobacteria bacterium]|nr:prolyl-tRNA synthetase associated domain-containing protein [Pseudomonadota bacterium]
MTIFNQTDTSPCAQDYLPVSSDILLCLLDRWGIKYNAHTHIPLRTVADSKRIQNRFLSPENGGGHIKNLYLRDHKKKNILLVAKQDRVIDLKNIDKILGTGRLSFGSEERLMEHLGVRPGSVTPLSMITGVNKNVSLYLDHTLKF